MPARASLEQSIKDEAGRLGFVLAGFTTPDPPAHLTVFEDWLRQGRHASMSYMEAGRARRADPRLVMPECRSILVLAAPYADPKRLPNSPSGEADGDARGRVAAYAWSPDYHTVFPRRLAAIVSFIEKEVGHRVSSRSYTDTGPILERELAQRAGLGWIGKNTCLINPRHGSYFLLAETFLDLELTPDPAFGTDHCGKCTRCVEVCPTQCILPDRTLDAGRCLSYLTIELRDGIPPQLRPLVGNWVFGCDVCQMVCPWNRFAGRQGDRSFAERELSAPNLIAAFQLTPEEFNARFRNSPIRRAKHRGYRRNVLTALGNRGGSGALSSLEEAKRDVDPLVREHAAWAIDQITARMSTHEENTASHQ
jgi:epoxyqueuosine reductase